MGLFCDDTLIVKEIHSPSDSAALQKDLDNIAKWTDLWGMSFKTDKCVVMTLTNKRSPVFTDYFLNNKTLSREGVIKYLGVHIDNKLNFKHHIEQPVSDLS